MEPLQIELLDAFKRGGPIMWVLLFLSIVMLVVFIERLLFLHRNHIRSKEFLSGIENALRKGRLIEALTICQDTPGPAATMVKAGLLRYRQSDNEIREVVREAAIVEMGPVKRRVGALNAIAQVAPMLGFLGTVLGMVDAFRTYESSGVYVTAGHLAAGGWQAMVTTAAGLTLGIVAILLHHFILGRIRTVAHEMEWLGQELLVIFAKVKDSGVATDEVEFGGAEVDEARA